QPTWKAYKAFQEQSFRFRCERDDLDVAVPVQLALYGTVLFQHAVKVAAAEAERADGRPAGMVIASDPGAHSGTDVERRLRIEQRVLRCADLNRRRQNFEV